VSYATDTLVKKYVYIITCTAENSERSSCAYARKPKASPMTTLVKAGSMKKVYNVYVQNQHSTLQTTFHFIFLHVMCNVRGFTVLSTLNGSGSFSKVYVENTFKYRTWMTPDLPPCICSYHDLIWAAWLAGLQVFEIFDGQIRHLFDPVSIVDVVATAFLWVSNSLLTWCVCRLGGRQHLELVTCCSSLVFLK